MDHDHAGDRLAQQRASLIALTQRQRVDDVMAELRTVAETAATTLGVERVSIWRYRADHGAIECSDLFELSSGRHSAGAVLTAQAHPRYFHALAAEQIIAAEDAVRHPDTSEFADEYLRPLGIASMLDAPIVRLGRRLGVLCHEHVGSPRLWSEDEKTFAVAMANLVALALEAEERRIAERSLAESLERFQIVARATNDAVWDWHVDADVLWWSENFTSLFGYSLPDSEPGLASWINRVHPDDVAVVHDSFMLAIEQGAETWIGEYRFRRSDGSYAAVLDRGYLQRGPDGKATRVIGAMQDVTESRTAAEALRHSEERYRLLFELNPEPMWVYDVRTFRFLAVNQAAVAKYGYSREEFLAMTIKDIRPPEEVERLLAEAGAPSTRVQHAGLWRHRCKSGQLLTVEVSTHAMEFGGQPAAVVLAHDVTMRHEAENRMREQLDELVRWQRVIVAREGRVAELKAEVNQLLQQQGRPEKYRELGP